MGEIIKKGMSLSLSKRWKLLYIYIYIVNEKGKRDGKYNWRECDRMKCEEDSFIYIVIYIGGNESDERKIGKGKCEMNGHRTST